jgi:hypothetical protein
MLHLEYFVGPVFDDMSDGVPVGRAQQKGLQDKQIESALEKVGV